MKKIAFGIAIMFAAAIVYGGGDDERGGDGDIEAHATEVVVDFDEAIRLWYSRGYPGEVAREISFIVCKVGTAVTREDNAWIYVRARDIAYANSIEALDATDSYESYQSYVEAELSAFTALHPDISPETLLWLKEVLWERWWWMVVERDVLELDDPARDPAVLAQRYESHICAGPAPANRRELRSRIGGGLLFLAGIAIQAVDTTTLVPSVGVSAASVASGVTIMAVGWTERFRNKKR